MITAANPSGSAGTEVGLVSALPTSLSPMNISDNRRRFNFALDEIPRGMLNVALPPLSLLEDADLAGIGRCTGLEIVIYILGNMEALHFSEYRLDLISIQSGIYVGQNRSGGLVWRRTILTEHPNLLRLPASAEAQSVFEDDARIYAEMAQSPEPSPIAGNH